MQMTSKLSPYKAAKGATPGSGGVSEVGSVPTGTYGWPAGGQDSWQKTVAMS